MGMVDCDKLPRTGRESVACHPGLGKAPVGPTGQSATEGFVDILILGWQVVRIAEVHVVTWSVIVLLGLGTLTGHWSVVSLLPLIGCRRLHRCGADV